MLPKHQIYPPNDTRGFGPLRAIDYGALDTKDYVNEKNFYMLRFLQIEHINMIKELENIIQLPYIDGFLFGPNDLSASLGEFLDVFGETTFSVIQQTCDTLKKHNKIVGLAGSMNEADIKRWATLDLDILFSGADWSFVYNQGKTTLEIMKKHYKNK